MSYYLQDGTAVTAEQIKAAFAEGKAILVHGHTDGGISTGLMLDGVDIDTRDECYSVWEEVWTSAPKNIQAALRAAYA